MAIGILRLAAAGLALVILYPVGNIIYNIFFHPLRHFPGPFWMRATRLLHDYKVITGVLVFDMLELHKKYGDVVRIAPNELAFANQEAWKEIMGHRGKSNDRKEFEKFQPFYNPIGQPSTVIGAVGQEHAMLRRLLSHGFSDRILREQQPLIMKYIDLLIQRVHERHSTGPVDLARWYNFTTFDIIGDLSFGESFGCLENSDYHPWVKMIFSTAKFGSILQTAIFYPLLRKLIIRMVASPRAQQHFKEHQAMTREKLLRRMELGNERPDLVEGLLRRKDEWNISVEQIESNCGVLIIAGSETTATLLAGVTFLLLQRPETLRKLTEEVRSTFQMETEIDLTSVNKLTYMFACLDEALRMYPPVPLGLPRLCPKGGAEVSGHFIPEDTVCGIHHWAVYHSEKNFKDPFEFRPERWMQNHPEFADDKLDAVQPFQVGPRNCLGKNLAYLEMRVIIARLVWNFDMTLADESRQWFDQKVFNFWEKPPLMVHMTPRNHSSDEK